MRASVIIPTWNSYATKRGSVELVLEGLFRQDAGRFEVVVVDDGSADGSGERLRRVRAPRGIGLRVLELPHTGNRSAVRNRGVARSRGEALVFVDDDTLFLSRDGLRRLLGRIRRGAFACGAARHWSYLDWTPEAVREALRRGDFGGLARRSVLPPPGLVGRRGFPAEFSYVANCGAVHRSDFRKVRGFDEEGYGGWGLEDVDLMLRLLLAGTRFTNVHEEIRVLHLTHPLDEEGHRGREGNSAFYRRRERELGWRLDPHALFGTRRGPALRRLDSSIRLPTRKVRL